MKKILFFLLFISNFYWAQWSISNAERSILISIYNSTDGENWNRNWDMEKDPSTWFGVVVENGNISELNLSGNALKGNFPTILSTLTSLKKIDLSDNNLTGEIPPGLSALSSIAKLDVSNNRLTGDPKNTIATLTNLQHLGLGGNQFTISDANALLQNLNELTYLNIADFGIDYIPSKIGTLPNLETLILDRNPILINSYNNLTGLPSLAHLSLSGTTLAQIPSALATNTRLSTLNLSQNLINDNGVAVLSSLTNLEWLSLEDNELTQVPPQLSSFQKLKTLNLGRNKISGGLDPLGNLNNLQQLFLHNNQLSGNIPSLFLSMPKLMMLNLNSNQLSGDLSDKLPPITLISNNRFNKDQLVNYIIDYTEDTEFAYSPQRYDAPKEILGVLGHSATLDQSLSGNYSFTWFKNLGDKLSATGESLYFNSIEESDYADYTVEAYYFSKLSDQSVFQLSLFREPISLVKELGTADPNEWFNIYPNPTSDYIHILNSKNDIEKVYILDLSGKIMMSDSKTKINVSHLPSGVYVLHIKTQSGIKNYKFIKH